MEEVVPKSHRMERLVAIVRCDMQETSVFCLNFKGFMLLSTTRGVMKFVPKRGAGPRALFRNQIQTVSISLSFKALGTRLGLRNRNL